VDVAGIEPAAPCLQNKLFASRKASQFSDCPDNKAFRFQSRMCAAVSGYVRLIIGSLQKSLQCIEPIIVSIGRNCGDVDTASGGQETR
jgi:hypothetical protein